MVGTSEAMKEHCLADLMVGCLVALTVDMLVAKMADLLEYKTVAWMAGMLAPH